MLIIFLAPPHDQLAQLIFIRLAGNFRREPTGGSTKHPGKVVIIENFLTWIHQICNAHDEIQYVSKSCLHIYNVRWLQLTVLWELDYPQLIVYVSWIEHTMLKAGGASWGNVYVHWCCGHWSVSVAYRCERIVEWGSCSCAWCRRYGGLKWRRITWPFESMDALL